MPCAPPVDGGGVARLHVVSVTARGDTRCKRDVRDRPDGYRAPARVTVIGAGVVGLSCAWSLQEHGIDVCVIDRKHPGAGASWQNAGFVSPAICVPLPEPSILRYGLRALLSPRSPVSLVRAGDPHLLRFMVTMVRHCRTTSWRRSMAAYRVLNERVFDSYRFQLNGGVSADVRESDLIACFAEPSESGGFLHEMEEIVGAGQATDVSLLTGDEARQAEPHLSGRVAMAVVVRGQQHLTPCSYVEALAKSVGDRGGKIVQNTPITAVERRHEVLIAKGPAGELEADATVIAAGAWAAPLLAGHGVRVPLYGGRGYSFTVATEQPFCGPLYLPSARVGVTPQGDRVRFAGIMEFGSPDAAMRPARIAHMIRAVQPMLQNVDWSTKSDDWMGPRPLSADGVPLVGVTRTPGLYVAGGHGMFGMTLGPLTGLLLATQIATGVTPPELAPLDPCR
jgi:D-amino-acid dehydrogenase